MIQCLPSQKAHPIPSATDPLPHIHSHLLLVAVVLPLNQARPLVTYILKNLEAHLEELCYVEVHALSLNPKIVLLN